MFLLTHFDSSQKGREQTFDLKESLWYSLNILLQGTYDNIICMVLFIVLWIDSLTAQGRGEKETEAYTDKHFMGIAACDSVRVLFPSSNSVH